MGKKVIVILIILAVSFTSLWADETLGSGVVEFKGKIIAGLYFTVESLQTESVNLLSEDLQPGGLGIDIGKWSLRVDNPPVEQTSHTVTYSYDELKSSEVGVTDEIAFLLYERNESEETSVPTTRSSGSSVIVSSGGGAGPVNVVKVFSAKLTNAGFAAAMKAAATDTYQSNITISLSAE
ncbi:MAG: hypothetical protein ACOXZ4_04495 [Sphaerochaetaceae bacterium]